MSTKPTRDVKPGDRLTTPDGSRTGMVRSVHPDGPMGQNPGKIGVHFQHGSVTHHTPPAPGGPRTWTTSGPDEIWTDAPANMERPQ